MAAAVGIDLIFLLSPTTTDRRIDAAGLLGRGFLYVISRLGVTGARDTLPEDAPALAARVRSRTTLPIAVGFGLSRPEHVRQVGGWADAAVVGSALVSVVEADADRPDLADRVERYVRWLKGEAGDGDASWEPIRGVAR
jgi:tryptophan synthase alpha chain